MTHFELRMKKVAAISLGCDKNRVDLERILFSLKTYGFTISNSIYDADIVIVNTCAFILPARQESITEIFHCIDLKKNKQIEKIIVTGCFPEKSLEELQDSLPEVDAFVMVRDNYKIANIIEKTYSLTESKLNIVSDRILSGQSHYAYLKIADGCDNACAYCTIPRIRGRYRSVPMDDILKEAKSLVKRGVKELIVVAQDTTRYGEDLYGKNKLVELIQKLSKIDNLVWIRLLYCYPEKINKELLDEIKSNPKVCNYIDVPLQHIDDGVLTNMRRRLGEGNTRNLIETIKNEYSEIKLRSTFIIGFPKETAKDFQKLCNFLKKEKLEFVGFFPYSKEEGTRAYFYKGQVPNIIKKHRLKKIMQIQNSIMDDIFRNYINTETIALIDYFDEQEGKFIAHTEFLTPEVDCLLKIVDNNNVEIGHFYNIKLTSYNNAVFEGEIINEYTK